MRQFLLLLYPLVFLLPLCAEETSFSSELVSFVNAPSAFPTLGTSAYNTHRQSIESFLNRFNLSEDAFSRQLIAYFESLTGHESNKSKSRVIVLMSNLADTNSIPFLLEVLNDSHQKAIWRQALYTLGKRGSGNEYKIITEKMVSGLFATDVRKGFYTGCINRMGWEVTEALNYQSFSGRIWYDVLFDGLKSESDIGLRLQIDNGLDRYLKGWRTSEERLELLRSWQNEPLVPEESLRLLGLRIAALHEARKTGNDRVACEWKPRKISSEDLDKMKQQAEALRNAPPPPPYEGPLVVDMEDAAE